MTTQGPTLLGHIAWLWSCSPLHADWPCHLLQKQVVPALRHRQCLLVSDGQRPVAYAAWAWLNEPAQQRYLLHPHGLREGDWRSGPHLWWIDWVAPFGHTQAMARWLKAHVFSTQIARALRVKRNSSVGRVMDMHGDSVPWSERHLSQHQFVQQFQNLQTSEAWR